MQLLLTTRKQWRRKEPAQRNKERKLAREREAKTGSAPFASPSITDPAAAWPSHHGHHHTGLVAPCNPALPCIPLAPALACLLCCLCLMGQQPHCQPYLLWDHGVIPIRGLTGICLPPLVAFTTFGGGTRSTFGTVTP